MCGNLANVLCVIVQVNVAAAAQLPIPASAAVVPATADTVTSSAPETSSVDRSQAKEQLLQLMRQLQQEGQLPYEDIHRLLLRNSGTGGPKVEVKDEKATVQQVPQQSKPAVEKQLQPSDVICVIEHTKSINPEVFINIAGPPDIVTSSNRGDSRDLESAEAGTDGDVDGYDAATEDRPAAAAEVYVDIAEPGDTVAAWTRGNELDRKDSARDENRLSTVRSKKNRSEVEEEIDIAERTDTAAGLTRGNRGDLDDAARAGTTPSTRTSKKNRPEIHKEVYVAEHTNTAAVSTEVNRGNIDDDARNGTSPSTMTSKRNKPEVREEVDIAELTDTVAALTQINRGDLRGAARDRKSTSTMRPTRGRLSADKEMALTDAVTALTQVNKGDMDHNNCEGKNHSTRRLTRNRPVVSEEMDTVRHSGADAASPQVNREDLDLEGDEEKSRSTMKSTENRVPTDVDGKVRKRCIVELDRGDAAKKMCSSAPVPAQCVASCSTATAPAQSIASVQLSRVDKLKSMKNYQHMSRNIRLSSEPSASAAAAYSGNSRQPAAHLSSPLTLIPVNHQPANQQRCIVELDRGDAAKKMCSSARVPAQCVASCSTATAPAQSTASAQLSRINKLKSMKNYQHMSRNILLSSEPSASAAAIDSGNARQPAAHGSSPLTLIPMNHQPANQQSSARVGTRNIFSIFAGNGAAQQEDAETEPRPSNPLPASVGVPLGPSLNTALNRSLSLRSMYCNLTARSAEWMSLVCCDFTTSRKTLLQCSFCPKLGELPRNVGVHVRDQHPELVFALNKDKPPTTQLYIKCRYCSFVTVESTHAWIHFEAHHGISDIMDRSGRTASLDLSGPDPPGTFISINAVMSDTPAYACFDCTAVVAEPEPSTSLQILSRHVARQHPDSDNCNGSLVKLLILTRSGG